MDIMQSGFGLETQPRQSCKTNIGFLRLYHIYTFLSVRLYPIQVKTAEPDGYTFFEATHMTPGKVLWMLKITKNCLQRISLFENLRLNIFKPTNFFVIVLYCTKK